MPHASPPSISTRRLDHVHAGVNPRRRGPGRRCRNFRCVGALVASVALLPASAAAAELLVGTAPDGGGSQVRFRLEAENRQDLVGGRIILGELEYEISRVSRLGLVGARRFAIDAGDGRKRYAEFLVFSSSYSEQTAVGKPWLAARDAYGCDRPYNTYFGFYRIEGETAVKSLGPIPYPDLAEDLSRSHHSHVSCFMARPPD